MLIFGRVDAVGIRMQARTYVTKRKKGARAGRVLEISA